MINVKKTGLLSKDLGKFIGKKIVRKHVDGDTDWMLKKLGWKKDTIDMKKAIKKISLKDWEKKLEKKLNNRGKSNIPLEDLAEKMFGWKINDKRKK